MDMKRDHSVRRTVFASISPGGGPDTFIHLRRLFLAQAALATLNAGPPTVTGFIILNPEQLLNMSAICAAWKRIGV